MSQQSGPEAELPIGLADTHCHLTDPAFDIDRDEVIARAGAAGVNHIVAVGGGGPVETSERAAELSERYPQLRATAGIHPHDASSFDDEAELRIRTLLAAKRVVAVGETGLDFYYDHSPRQEQRVALARHLALAGEYGLPVVLHCRDAEGALREVLQAECKPPVEGVVHCFTGSYGDARWYLDFGLQISFTGIITFKKAESLRETVGKLPLDRLMVETDAPYLAPVPHRGRRNEPAYVAHVAATLAEIHRCSIAEVVEKTGANAQRLFFGTASRTD